MDRFPFRLSVCVGGCHSVGCSNKAENTSLLAVHHVWGCWGAWEGGAVMPLQKAAAAGTPLSSVEPQPHLCVCAAELQSGLRQHPIMQLKLSSQRKVLGLRSDLSPPLLLSAGFFPLWNQEQDWSCSCLTFSVVACRRCRCEPSDCYRS